MKEYDDGKPRTTRRSGFKITTFPDHPLFKKVNAALLFYPSSEEGDLAAIVNSTPSGILFFSLSPIEPFYLLHKKESLRQPHEYFIRATYERGKLVVCEINLNGKETNSAQIMKEYSKLSDDAGYYLRAFMHLYQTADPKEIAEAVKKIHAIHRKFLKNRKGNPDLERRQNESFFKHAASLLSSEDLEKLSKISKEYPLLKLLELYFGISTVLRITNDEPGYRSEPTEESDEKIISSKITKTELAQVLWMNIQFLKKPQKKAELTAIIRNFSEEGYRFCGVNKESYEHFDFFEPRFISWEQDGARIYDYRFKIKKEEGFIFIFCFVGEKNLWRVKLGLHLPEQAVSDIQEALSSPHITPTHFFAVKKHMPLKSLESSND